MTSFVNNFSTSAIGCNKPRGPTRFGPCRTCIQAISLRSHRIRYATHNSSATERENAREQPYGRPSRAEGLSAECVEGVEHDGNVQTDNSSGECRLSQLDKTVFIRASQSGPAAQNRPITSADKWTEIRFLTARFWADARPRRISVLP